MTDRDYTRRDVLRAVMATEADLRDMMESAVRAFDKAVHTGAEGDRVAWIWDALWLHERLDRKAKALRDEGDAWEGDR